MADYSSGMVQSNGHFNSAYGYYEARILNPAGVNHASVWPAFWTNGQSWPTNGEIDIMECYGTDPSCSYHYHWSGGVAGGNSTVLGSTNEFHIYAAYWQPDKVQWFYDGVLVGTKTGGIIPSPHYIIANLGVIGTQVIIPSIMQVDYIRVWSSGNVIPTNTAQTVTATNTPAHSTATKTATSTATMLPVTITPPAVIPTATYACISYPTYEICSRPKP